VESNAQFRKCGYRVGKYVTKYSVFDLPEKKDEILKMWERDIKECKGCYWVLPFILNKTFDIVRFDSGYWKRKYQRR
jgi:hypothetical protein